MIAESKHWLPSSRPCKLDVLDARLGKRLPPRGNAGKRSAVTWADGDGGDERTRTADPLLAKQVLSQLSYIPDARYTNRAYSGAFRRLPPRAEHIRLRGRSTDLERPEEWERQDLEPRVLFVCFALERTA